MKIGALVLLEGRALAAWHWPWSLTWRWVLSMRWHTRHSGRLGFYWQRTHGGGGVLCGVNTPVVDVSFQSQPNMRRKKWWNYCH